MIEIIAKVNKEYKNVLSQDGNVVEDLDLDSIQPIEFSTSHKLEDDEWFKISNFSQQDFFIEECSTNHSTTSLSQVSSKEYNKIVCIGILQGNQKHFQRTTPKLFVNKKTILDYSGDPKIVEHRKQIEIKENSDAIYHTDTDMLYFKNLSKIKTIFPGIENLHREATQPEVNAFISHDFISTSDYTSDSVGTMNRKRIADIGSKFKDLPEDKQEKLIKYAREKAGLDLKDDKFVITCENDLKNLLYAMDQRYYTADIYDEERIATAFRPAK